MEQNNSFSAFFDRVVKESNSTTPPLLDHAEDDFSVIYGYSLLALIPVSLFLLVSNSLLIYIVVSKRKNAWVRRVNHIFYLILSDLIVGVSLIPFIADRLLRFHEKPFWLCAVLSYTSFACQAVSFYHMLAVCIHRFRKLRKIDLPNGKDDYRYGVESLLIWTFVVLAVFPPYALSEKRSDYLSFCHHVAMFGLSDKVVVIYLLTLFCLPCVLTNVIYVAVICRVRNRLIAVQPSSAKRLKVQFINSRNADNQTTSACDATVSAVLQPPTTNNGIGLGQKPNKVNKIIGYLLIVLNISILSPVIMFGMILGGNQNVPLWITALTYINNICSPFIYSFSIAPLREEIQTTLRKWFSWSFCSRQ